MLGSPQKPHTAARGRELGALSALGLPFWIVPREARAAPASHRQWHWKCVLFPNLETCQLGVLAVLFSLHTHRANKEIGSHPIGLHVAIHEITTLHCQTRDFKLVTIPPTGLHIEAPPFHRCCKTANRLHHASPHPLRCGSRPAVRAPRGSGRPLHEKIPSVAGGRQGLR